MSYISRTENERQTQKAGESRLNVSFSDAAFFTAAAWLDPWAGWLAGWLGGECSDLEPPPEYTSGNGVCKLTNMESGGARRRGGVGWGGGRSVVSSLACFS